MTSTAFSLNGLWAIRSGWAFLRRAEMLDVELIPAEADTSR
jgi:hypothetical protein